MTNMNDRLKHQKYNQMWIIISFLIIILTNNIFVFANQISAHSPFQLDGTINSYLQFPSWHYFFSASDEQVQSLNLESSFSFEFKCFHSEQWSSLNNTNTRPVGGLLLYTDDQTGLGGIFLEIKLLSETSLRIRIDDSASSSESVRTKNIIELQSLVNFTDDQWHRIELIRQVQPNSLTTVVNDHHETRSEPITLKVDSEVIHKRIELSKETYHNNKRKAKNIRHHGRSVFIGGLPPEYREHYLDHLALPTSAYELHFQGAIRNVLYAAQSGSHSYSSSSSDEKQRLLEDVDLRIQFPITNGGLLPERFVHTNQCIDQRHWCQHGGYCYATQDGVFCDCSITDYEGPYCQKEKSSLEVAFRGQYIGYNHLDLSTSWSFVSTIESFEFSFRTKSANGLILWNGDDDEDYLSIALRNAGLLLTIKLGSAPIQEKVISPSKVRFDDNQWHSVVVSRKIREISPSTHFSHFLITVDGIYTQHGSIAGTIPYFISKLFFVGGMDGTISNHKSINLNGSNHFIGCLRKIVFISNNVRLDLLDLINVQYNQKQQSIKSVGLVQLYGKHDLTSTNEHYQLPRCQDVDSFDPITFTTSDSYLKLSDGWNSPNEGTLSLKIRTNEPNGVLLYSVGTLNNTHHGNVYDYFALELLDGQLYLLQHLGSLPVKVKSTTKRIDDNYWHTIQVKRTGRNGQVVVDGDIVSDFVSPGTSNNLDLGDSLYLGGYPRFTGNRLTYTPPQLWSTAFGGGYIGCVSDLHLDGRLVDIVALAKKQDSGSIKPSCHSSTQSQCLPNPCQNGGMCIEGWNRYSCECSSTSFTGSVCAKNAATLSFNGEQYLMINLPEEQRTQVESLYIRFRTNKPNGIILVTQSSEPHYLAIILESGSIRVDLNYGGVVKEPIVVIGERLNDDQWHTVHVNRRGPSFDIDIDHRWNQTVDLIGKDYTLLVRTIHVGARINKPQTSKTVKSAHVSGFVGYMQNFVFNGHQYFEMTRDGHLTGGSIRMTAKLGKKNRVLHHAVTFKSKYTFIGLPQLKAYSGLNIYFQFKTREPNGLLFFNGGEKGHDFIALELIGGHLHYVFDLGDGPRRLQSKSGNSLNDNHWHTVTLGRPSLYQHTMLIDDTLMTTSTSTNANRNLHLDLDGLLYFGGVRDQMWSSIPKAIRSKHGFEGCIASLDLNGETFNLVGSEVLIPSTLVEAGCSAPINRCSSTACANRGICVQLWNSYTCDCDLTTYSGPTCTDGNASIAYSFGPNPGLVTYTFDDNNRPDTRNDLLAIGFLTTHKNGALLRVDSGTTADYLQLELIDGNILAVYNLGTEDIDIGELGMKVNDGKYHIVRLTRSGQNSTIQIDNHNVFTRSPAGKQMNIFNSHARIEIGGHKNILRGIIEKPFNGIISGLVFNKQHILDMAAEDDPRVKIEGDVELMVSVGNQDSSVLTTTTTTINDQLSNRMLSEPKSVSNRENGNDDLIYSGAGSGCLNVNEDEECAHITHEGSGDELITPVYVAVNNHQSRPTTTPSSVSGRNYNRPGSSYPKQCLNDDDDDDQCLEGSGYEPNSNRAGSSQSNYSSYDNINNNNYYTTPSWHSITTWHPPTVAPINRPPTYGTNVPMPPFFNTPPPFYTYGNEHNPEQPSYPIRPKTTAPSWTKPVYSISGPTRPIVPNSPSINSEEPPEIYEVPLQTPAVINDTTPSQIPEVLNRSSNDRTVMIIGMIAICLIVVVIIAPIILFFKVRLQSQEAQYKVETFGAGSGVGHKPFGTIAGQGSYAPFSPVVRATSIAGITGHPGLCSQPPPHGQMLSTNSTTLGRPGRPGTRPGTPTDRKKDQHEWYV